MGSTRLDRELAQAKTAYTAATIRLSRAMQRLFDLEVPIFGREPEPWSTEQIQAVLAVQTAWNDLVKTRRPYDQLERECRRGGW